MGLSGLVGRRRGLTRLQQARLVFRPDEPGETMGAMPLVEELFLLLTKEDSGKFLAVPQLDLALATACVLDLTEQRRVRYEGEGNGLGRLELFDATPTGNVLLDQVLRLCFDRRDVKLTDVLLSLTYLPRAVPPWAAALLYPSKRGLRSAVLEQLFRRASIQDLRTTRNQLRARLEDVLQRGGSPDRHTAFLVSLLHMQGSASWVLGDAVDRTTRKAINQRAAQILADNGIAVGGVTQAYRNSLRRIPLRIG